MPNGFLSQWTELTNLYTEGRLQEALALAVAIQNDWPERRTHIIRGCIFDMSREKGLFVLRTCGGRLLRRPKLIVVTALGFAAGVLGAWATGPYDGPACTLHRGLQRTLGLMMATSLMGPPIHGARTTGAAAMTSFWVKTVETP